MCPLWRVLDPSGNQHSSHGNEVRALREAMDMNNYHSELTVATLNDRIDELTLENKRLKEKVLGIKSALNDIRWDFE